MNSISRKFALAATRLVVLPAVVILGGCMASNSHRDDDNVQPMPQPRIEWPRPELNGSIFQTGRTFELYQSRAARQVGDIVTILLDEKTQASKKANTKVSKESELEVTPDLMFGKTGLIKGLGVNAGQENSFDGAGAADQSNALSGSVTCVVTEVLPNGYLVIQGQKKLTLNRGDEYINISGIVRPDDVADDNTIPSKRVANARIAYTGKGELADANEMGWLSKFFFSTIWPF